MRRFELDGTETGTRDTPVQEGEAVFLVGCGNKSHQMMVYDYAGRFIPRVRRLLFEVRCDGGGGRGELEFVDGVVPVTVYVMPDYAAVLNHCVDREDPNVA